jgi:hypothetical protein
VELLGLRLDADAVPEVVPVPLLLAGTWIRTTPV